MRFVFIYTNYNYLQDSALEHLLHRFCNDEIYSYIGDILLAVNPRVPLPLYDAQVFNFIDICWEVNRICF